MILTNICLRQGERLYIMPAMERQNNIFPLQQLLEQLKLEEEIGAIHGNSIYYQLPVMSIPPQEGTSFNRVPTTTMPLPNEKLVDPIPVLYIAIPAMGVTLVEIELDWSRKHRYYQPGDPGRITDEHWRVPTKCGKYEVILVSEKEGFLEKIAA